jgi:sulfite exporter TauE/SafE
MEAFFLGLSVGLVCLASCGAVLVPWLVVQRRTLAGTAWLLAQVLAGRLAGYLLFALVAWGLGVVLTPPDLRSRAVLFGAAHLALAAMLVWYAIPGPARAPCEGTPPVWSRLSTVRRRLARGGPAALGFVTGLNLCPPFVAATVRAAEARSLTGALAFFAVFFLGTSVWFLPFLVTGTAYRVPQARAAARVALGIVAAYYAYTGTLTLGWRLLYG